MSYPDNLSVTRVCRRRWLDELYSAFRQLTDRPVFMSAEFLKGAKPAELPVVQPTKFEFVMTSRPRIPSGSARTIHIAGARRRGDRVSTRARVHHAVRRCGCDVAARGSRAAADDAGAAHRCADATCGRRSRTQGAAGSVCGGAAATRLGRSGATCRLRRGAGAHPQGREARRPAGHAGDQVRTGHQPQDRQGARPRSAADKLLARADEVIE